MLAVESTTGTGKLTNATAAVNMLSRDNNTEICASHARIVFLGVHIHANGSFYEGEWKDNKMHGHGYGTYCVCEW